MPADDELSKDGHHRRYSNAVSGAWQKRRSRQIESRMIADYCREYLGNYNVWYRPFLGSIYPGQLEPNRSESEAAMLGVWRYHADAVAVGSSEVVLIEGAIRFDAAHVGKLWGYIYLLPLTPEFAPLRDRELHPIALSPQFDPLAALMCERFDIECVHYKPLYVEEYINSLERRKRRSPLSLLPSMARHGSRYADETRI